MITGAGGLVGRELRGRLSGSEAVIALRHDELDIADASAVRASVEKHRPDLIINCAVIGVDLCETRPDLARRINVEGPAALADAAQSIGSSTLHFSSNYVFDGSRTDHQFYTIDDAIHPVNEYGRTKLAGEREVVNRCERTWIVRTSWVFGQGKDSFLATAASRLAAGERIQAITDTFASTTWVRDLTARVSEIIQRADYGTYHVVNSGICSYASFAEEAARILGLSCDRARQLIDRQSEDQLKRPAPRPRWTPMACLMSQRTGLAPLRDWREALTDYIASSKPATKK